MGLLVLSRKQGVVPESEVLVCKFMGAALTYIGDVEL